MNKSPFTLPRMKNTLRLLALLSLAGAPLLADAAAGRFLFVSGPAQVIAANGHARAAHRGDSFDQGETIATAAHTIAQLRMEDGNMISVRPNTRLRIDQFSYHGHPQASDRNYIRLTKGAFRSITGAIGKDHYRITTPDATIGIRGTDHVAMYVPAGSSATIPAGTYDKVNTGRTFLATPHGMIEIAPNQAGYVASAAAAPHLLPVIPDFLKSSSTPPRTAAASSKQDSGASSSKQETASGSSKQDSAASSNKQDTASGSSKQDTAASSNTPTESATSTASTDNTAPSTSTDSSTSLASSTSTVTSSATTMQPLPLVQPAPVASGPAGFAVAALQTTASSPNPVGGASAAITEGDSYTIDASGNLTALTLHHNQNASSVLQFDAGTSTARTLSQSVYTDPATGDVVHWGRWSVPNTTSSYHLAIDGTTILPTSDFHYMYSNNTTSAQQLQQLPQLNILTGNYTMVPGASTLTDGLGHVGAVNSASMGVNFSTQTITSYNLDMTVNSNHWQASLANPVALSGGQYTLNPTNGLNVTETPASGVAAAATGYAQGTFVGSTATSTINMFGLHSTTTGDNAVGTVLMHR
jgi:hypothetical protein